MQYLYEYYSGTATSSVRGDTTTNLNEIKEKDVTSPYYIVVTDLKTNKTVCFLNSIDDLESWRIGQERSFVWNKEMPASWKKDAPNSAHTPVKPIHYNNFIDEYEWLDVMSRIHRYENPEVFKGAVELQIRKYLDRNGKKDSELQELLKGLFYYIYLVMYIQNNEKPIMAKDIHKIMELLK